MDHANITFLFVTWEGEAGQQEVPAIEVQSLIDVIARATDMVFTPEGAAQALEAAADVVVLYATESDEDEEEEGDEVEQVYSDDDMDYLPDENEVEDSDDEFMDELVDEDMDALVEEDMELVEEDMDELVEGDIDELVEDALDVDGVNAAGLMNDLVNGGVNGGDGGVNGGVNGQGGDGPGNVVNDDVNGGVINGGVNGQGGDGPGNVVNGGGVNGEDLDNEDEEDGDEVAEALAAAGLVITYAGIDNIQRPLPHRSRWYQLVIAARTITVTPVVGL